MVFVPLEFLLQRRVTGGAVNTTNGIGQRYACMRWFLPSSFDYTLVEEENNKGTQRRIQWEHELQIRLLPYVVAFREYLLKAGVFTSIDKIESTHLLIHEQSERLVTSLFANQWHPDEVDPGKHKNIVVPLSLPIIHTRIAESGCDWNDARTVKEQRNFKTCEYMNRGSASYFDASACHRGMRAHELGSLKGPRIALTFQLLNCVVGKNIYKELDVVDKYTYTVPRASVVPKGAVIGKGVVVPNGVAFGKRVAVPRGNVVPNGVAIGKGAAVPRGNAVPKGDMIRKGDAVPKGAAVPMGPMLPKDPADAAVKKEDKPIGTGGFGTVRKIGNTFVAKEANNPDDTNDTLRVERVAIATLIRKMDQRIRRAYTLIVTNEEMGDEKELVAEGLTKYMHPKRIIVSKKCTGKDLFEFAVENEFEFKETFDLVAEACINVVSHMHDIGHNHCDIKLENIMMCKVNGNQTARIIDFGLMDKCKTSGTSCYNPKFPSNEKPCLFQSMIVIAQRNDVHPDIFAIGYTLAHLCLLKSKAVKPYVWPLHDILSTYPDQCNIASMMMTRYDAKGVKITTDKLHWAAIKDAMTAILGRPVMLKDRDRIAAQKKEKKERERGRFKR